MFARRRTTIGDILRACILLGLIGVLAALFGCSDKDKEFTLASLNSPTQRLTAELVRIEHEGMFVWDSTVYDIVRVKGIGVDKPASLVFSMETNDSDRERPKVIWESEDVLEISIPRGVSVGYWATQTSSLQINVMVR